MSLGVPPRGAYLELWVGLAAHLGEVSLDGEPGEARRVMDLHTLEQHAGKVEVKAEGDLYGFSHSLPECLKLTVSKKQATDGQSGSEMEMEG